MSERTNAGRAELIRVQCRSEHESPCRDCSGWSQRDCREPGCKFGSDDLALSLLADRIRPSPANWFVGGGGPGETRVGVFWRRGFIAHARLPLADWTRYGPGIAAANPVETARPTDRSPYWNGGGWTFYRDDRPRPSDIVPLHAELPGRMWSDMDDWMRTPRRGQVTSSARRFSFGTSEDAGQWLSDLCIAWALKKAGAA